MAAAGLAEWVRFEDGPSAGRLPARLAGVSDVGLVFLDGDHTRRGCLADFSALFPHLAEQACLALHDIYPDRCGWFGPRLLLDMFRRARAYDHMAQFDIEERADLDRYGVAICYMREVGADLVATSNFLQRLELLAMRSHLTAAVENAWFQSERSWPGTLGELGKFAVRRALKPLIPK